MGTDYKAAVKPPSSAVTLIESKNSKKKKSKINHHKSKHSKQQRSSSSSSSSSSSTDRKRNSLSTKKYDLKDSYSSEKSSKDKTKSSSTVHSRNKKSSSNNKKQSKRSKDDSSESPHRRSNHTTRSRSRSRSKSHSDQSSRSRSTDRSRSHDSPSHNRNKNSLRHPRSNMPNAYSLMSNFIPNMTHRYPNPSNSYGRGSRMLHNAAGMIGNRPPFSNMRGSMNNAAYLHNVQNIFQNVMQQKQKGGPDGKYANPNNPNNRFYQQFQDNYKKLKAGEKISKLYQASFPVHHIPREMRFNFRLLGRNIFTASDEEEEEAKNSDKSSKKKQERHRSSSDSSEDERREEDDESNSTTITAGRSKISSKQKTSTKTNRNRTSSTAKPVSDPSNFRTLLADIIKNENPEIIANTFATAAAVINSKRERTKKTVQKFKDYARFQQAKAVGATNISTTNPEEAEKKIHGLARRLQMKTIGLHDDYEARGMKRSDDSSDDSDSSENRHRSPVSTNEHLKDKDIGSDTSTNSQRQRQNSKSIKKINSSGQLIAPSDDEHYSDGNNSDGSMLNLNEDLKPIGYYIKDRERMLHEMFRCVRGHKLQVILPETLKINLYNLLIGTATTILSTNLYYFLEKSFNNNNNIYCFSFKTRSLEEIKAKCLDQLDILSKKRIRAILTAQPMISSSGTEDSTDEDDQDVFTLYPHLKSSLDLINKNATTTSDTTEKTTITSTDENKKPLSNSKFRPVQMHAVTENFPSSSTMPQSILSAPTIVGVNEDVNNYYEDFNKIKKVTNLRRTEPDDESTPFPDYSGKVLQPIGTNLPKFEFKPIKSLTHSQKAHFYAHRIANRQQQQTDLRQELDDLLSIDDFVLPNRERPLTSAESSINREYQHGLPAKIQHKVPVGPPKKGSLGDLLRQRKTNVNGRSPSPIISERIRNRSHSLSSSSERLSRHSSRERIESTDNNEVDMSDLSKLLDLNEEDELLLLQIEVEQEERNLRRQEKRKRREEKKKKKNDLMIIRKCLSDLIDGVIWTTDTKSTLKRPCDENNNIDNVSKKVKLDNQI